MTTFPARRGLAQRALSKGSRIGAKAIDRAMEPLVPLVCPGSDRDLPAVFIVGCPRSGSTLLYQAMVYAYRFAYMSNDVARFPRSGPLVARILRVDKRPGEASFSSTYGRTSGAGGPSEAGAFWDLAFPWVEDHAVDADAWPDGRRRFVQRHLASFIELYDAPFLCKNLWHSVRIEALDRAFPRAAFIVMRRDPFLVVESMIPQQSARQANGGRFWSIRPRGMASKMDLPVTQQVAWQVALTTRAIAEARDRVGQHRFFDLPYEDFCERPEAWIDQVGGFLQGRGIEVQRRATIGERFTARRRCSLPADVRAQVEAVLSAP